MIDVTAYWPRPAPGQTLTNTFDTGAVQRWSFDTWARQLRLDEYYPPTPGAASEWKDAWFWTVTPEGILEVADQLIAKWPRTIFGPTYRQDYARGYENFWGGLQGVGSLVSRQVAVRQFLSIKYGWNYIRFDGLVDLDVLGSTMKVLKMTRVETWDGVPADAVYYMALGLGFVGFDWGQQGTPQRAISTKWSNAPTV